MTNATTTPAEFSTLTALIAEARREVEFHSSTNPHCLMGRALRQTLAERFKLEPNSATYIAIWGRRAYDVLVCGEPHLDRIAPALCALAHGGPDRWERTLAEIEATRAERAKVDAAWAAAQPDASAC